MTSPCADVGDPNSDVAVATWATMAGDPGYDPLVAEQGHMLWGLVDSPDEMTEADRHLLLNAVVLTANGLLEPVPGL